MDLVRYEFAKLCQRKLFIVLSILLLAANLLTVYAYEKQTSAYFYIHGQRESYERFLQGDEEADYSGYYAKDLDEQRSYLDSYAIFTGEMANRVARMEQTSLYADQDSFIYRNLIKTQEDFAAFSDVVLKVDNNFGIRALAHYDSGILFTLVFLAVLTYFVLFYERDMNLLLLLKGCRRGHTALATAKLVTMILSAALFTLIQELGVVFFIGWLYGYGDLSRVIQSVSIFRNCAYHLTVGSAIVAVAAIRVAVALGLVCLLFGLGMIFRRETAAAAVAGIILGGEFFFCIALSSAGSLNGLKFINPFYCWNMEQVLGEYHNLDFFGYPVGKDVCAIALDVLWVIFLSVMGVFVFNRTCQIRSGGWLERLMQWLRSKTAPLGHRVSLLYYEFYKMLIQQKKGILLIILLIWCVHETMGIYGARYYAKVEEAAYHYYMDQVEGPVTEQTLAYLDAEEARLNGLRQEIRDIAAGDEGSASGKSFQIQVIQAELNMLEDGFELVSQQFDSLMEKQGDILDKYMLDERDYEELWQSAGTNVGFWFVGSAFMLLFIGGIYTGDEKRGMLLLLRTTANGTKKLERSKNRCAYICIGVVFLATELPLFLQYAEIDHLTTAGQRLCDFTNGWFESVWPLWLMLALLFVLKALSFWVVGILGLRLSRIMKDETVTFLIGIGIVGAITVVLYRLGLSISSLLIYLL